MTNENKKTSRANETRSKTERPKVWVPPSSLDAPPAPDGFRYRWIRAESIGFQDTKNITGRLREGYELVRQSSMTANTRESLGSVAFCLQRSLKKSQSNVKNT
jgi:hypothetical protein